MPSTTDFTDFCAGKLASRLASGTTSGATVTAQSVNGSPITWPTGAHRLKFVRKTRTGTEVETVGVASASQSGATVTLGTLTRQLSLTDGSTFSTGGNGRTFPANTEVYLTWDVFDAERTMKDDKVNTLTGAGAIRSTSTTTAAIRPNSVTTSQRTGMTAGNGDIVYDSDLGQLYQYIGGAWTAIGNTGTADASTTVAGKVEEATAAELGAGTAAGGTGARLFINPSLAVKTSSGAGDENKLPVLNSTGQLANGFLGSGTADSSSYLRGDRTWTSPLSSIGFFGDGSDGAVTWSVSTNLNPATEKRYTTATLNSGQTLSVSSVNTPLVIHNTGDVTINGTVDLNGKGGTLGAGRTGNGVGSDGTAGNSLITGWTNGAGTGSTADGSGGGSGASFDFNGASGSGTNAGTGGTKIDPERIAFMSSLLRGVVCGGGGGGGSVAGGGGTSGGGGAGGGALVWTIGGNLTLGASSIIRANGDNGTAGSGTTAASGQTAGGGGGGGGGMILVLVAGTITNSGVTVSATGGTGGNGHLNGSGNSGFKGGDSVNGKVIIYSLSTGTLITA